MIGKKSGAAGTAAKGFNVRELLAASLGFGAVMVFWSIYNSYVPLILDGKLSGLGTLSATAVSTLTGAIMTIDNLFGLVFQPVFGRRSDHMRSRYGKRMPFLIVGVPVCAVLFFLIPVMGRIAGVAGIIAMMLTIIVFNFVMSTWRAPCVAIMPDLVRPQYQSDGNAIVNMMAVIMSLVALAAGAILTFFGFGEALDAGDFRPVFIFGGIIAIVCLGVMLAGVRWRDNRGEPVTAAEEEQKKESLRSLRLSREALLSMAAMMAALFCISGSSDGFQTYYTLFATKQLGLSSTVATLVRAISGLSTLVFAVVMGAAGRRFGRKRVICAGTLVVAASHGVMLLLPRMGSAASWVLIACGAVYYVAFLAVNINTLPIMLAIGGARRSGAFTGYYYTATFTAAVVCPVVLGFFIGRTSYNFLNVFCAVLMIAAFCLMQLVHHGEEEEEAAAAAAAQMIDD